MIVCVCLNISDEQIKNLNPEAIITMGTRCGKCAPMIKEILQKEGIDSSILNDRIRKANPKDSGYRMLS